MGVIKRSRISVSQPSEMRWYIILAAMDQYPFERIKAYRLETFALAQHRRVHTQEQAIQFVQERGYIHFWPISGILLPSLWSAVAGDRPVADAHDDPGHVTWGWKDALLGKQAWYYAKILHKKASMLSMEVVPYFYALSENYGAFDEDYLTQYEQGRLTQEAKLVYETILREGTMDTVALRKATHMASQSSDSRFNRALVDLQADFKLVPVAVTQAGAWRYAFAYDIVARHYPEIPELAQPILESTARQNIVRLYFQSVGAARLNDLVRLFGWKPPLVQHTIETLVQAGFLRSAVHFDTQPGEWVMLTTLFTG